MPAGGVACGARGRRGLTYGDGVQVEVDALSRELRAVTARRVNDGEQDGGDNRVAATEEEGGGAEGEEDGEGGHGERRAGRGEDDPGALRELAQYVPVRLSMAERKLWRLLEVCCAGPNVQRSSAVRGHGACVPSQRGRETCVSRFIRNVRVAVPPPAGGAVGERVRRQGRCRVLQVPVGADGAAPPAPSERLDALCEEVERPHFPLDSTVSLDSTVYQVVAAASSTSSALLSTGRPKLDLCGSARGFQVAMVREICALLCGLKVRSISYGGPSVALAVSE